MTTETTETSRPTMASVLSSLRERILAECHVAIPGRVVSYDAGRQVASVEPLLRETFYSATGERLEARVPTIPEVPVLWPGGGGYGVVCPLAAGDGVLLVFADRNIDGWLATGSLSTPQDDRRHALTDAVAIPVLRSPARPLDHADASKVRLGQLAGGAGGVYALVRVDRLEAELGKLVDAIDAASKAAVPNDGGKVALTTLKTALSGWPGSLAADSVEVVE